MTLLDALVMGQNRDKRSINIRLREFKWLKGIAVVILAKGNLIEIIEICSCMHIDLAAYDA